MLSILYFSRFMIIEATNTLGSSIFLDFLFCAVEVPLFPHLGLSVFYFFGSFCNFSLLRRRNFTCFLAGFVDFLGFSHLGQCAFSILNAFVTQIRGLFCNFGILRLRKGVNVAVIWSVVSSSL